MDKEINTPERYTPPLIVNAKSAHVMILGQTMAGKGVLAKTIAQAHIDAGVGVIVFDPLNDSDWPCHFRTDDINEFLLMVKDSDGCAVFVDECSEVMTTGQKENHIIATRGRHWGHRAYLLSQRSYAAIAPIVRSQCSDLFVFNMSLKDAKELAEDWNDKALLQIVDFPPGVYFHKRRMIPAKKYKIFDLA